MTTSSTTSSKTQPATPIVRADGAIRIAEVMPARFPQPCPSLTPLVRILNLAIEPNAGLYSPGRRIPGKWDEMRFRGPYHFRHPLSSAYDDSSSLRPIFTFELRHSFVIRPQ